MSRFSLLLGSLLAAAPALASVKLYPLPPEISSDHFRVTVNGQTAPVAHAAANYFFVNFDLQGPAEISITAPSDGYWSQGVEVEPWRHGIRPRLAGRTITFSIAQPMKLSVSRPNDFRATSEMLFLFANAPETDAPQPDAANVRYYGPGVYHENIDLKRNQTLEKGAAAPAFPAADDAVHAEFAVKAATVMPGQAVQFDAGESRGNIMRYDWSFGDGTSATGKRVHHAFPDGQGTLWDGSGRFRVLLKITDAQGATDWAGQPVVVTTSLAPGRSVAHRKPGLAYRYYQGAWPELPDFTQLTAAATGVAPDLNAVARKRADDYAFLFDGYVKVPRDGGYSFVLLGQDGARIEVDGKPLAQSPPPLAQVCGSVGNMVQEARGTVGLRKGLHALRIAYTKTAGPDGFAVEWEGPGLALAPIPAAMLFHSSSDNSRSGEQARLQ